MNFKELYEKILKKEISDNIKHSNRMTQRDFCEKAYDYQQEKIEKLILFIETIAQNCTQYKKDVTPKSLQEFVLNGLKDILEES